MSRVLCSHEQPVINSESEVLSYFFTIIIWDPHHFSLEEKFRVVRFVSCDDAVLHIMSSDDQSNLLYFSSFYVKDTSKCRCQPRSSETPILNSFPQTHLFVRTSCSKQKRTVKNCVGSTHSDRIIHITRSLELTTHRKIPPSSDSEHRSNSCHPDFSNSPSSS